MSIDTFLISLGINLTSNFLYDNIKSFLQRTPDPTVDELKVEIQKHLKIENLQIIAAKNIDFLANNGDIDISGSSVFARESISFQSSKNTKFQIKNGSSIKTDQTLIAVDKNDIISGSGGATIEQSKDGITFSV